MTLYQKYLYCFFKKKKEKKTLNEQKNELTNIEMDTVFF